MRAPIPATDRQHKHKVAVAVSCPLCEGRPQPPKAYDKLILSVANLKTLYFGTSLSIVKETLRGGGVVVSHLSFGLRDMGSIPTRFMGSLVPSRLQNLVWGRAALWY